MKSATIAKIYQLLLITTFMVLVTTPAIKMVFSDKVPYSFTEKRPLSSLPERPASIHELDAFFTGLSTYLEDHFGYRDFLIYRYQREVRKRFDIIAEVTNTHQGIDHWFYLGHSEMLLDFAGKRPVSTFQLQQWAASYQAKRKWLADQGIEYLLVVPPNKQSVYPQFMMERWQEIRGVSRLQQLQNAFPEINDDELLDLATVMKQRDDETLYYKSDSHWTPFGAYLAYLQIAEKIEQKFPGVRLKKDFAFTAETTRTCSLPEHPCGDLTKMLLDFKPFEESFRNLVDFPSCAEKTLVNESVKVTSQKHRRPIEVACREAALKAIIFRDSFFVALEPFISENFLQAIYIWNEFNQQDVEAVLREFKPDIVIEEIVERNFPFN